MSSCPVRAVKDGEGSGLGGGAGLVAPSAEDVSLLPGDTEDEGAVPDSPTPEDEHPETTRATAIAATTRTLCTPFTPD